MWPAVGERGEWLAGQSIDGPFRHRGRAERLIQPDRRLVPVEHRPLESAVVALDRDPRECREQRTANAATTRGRPHEQILEIEARPCEERRVALEEQRESDGGATDL